MSDISKMTLPKKPKKYSAADIKSITIKYENRVSYHEICIALDKEYNKRYQKWLEDCIFAIAKCINIAKYVNIIIPTDYDDTPYDDIIIPYY